MSPGRRPSAAAFAALSVLAAILAPSATVAARDRPPAPPRAAAPGDPAADALDLAHEFVDRSGLARSFDDWLRNLEAQYLTQRTQLSPAPPERFFLDVAASFDLADRRRALDQAVARTLSPEDLRTTVEWLRLPAVETLPDRKERVAQQVDAALRTWQREASELVGARRGAHDGAAPSAVPRGTRDPADSEPLDQLMDKLGYGRPEAFRRGLVDAARKALPEEPESTWSSPAATSELDDVVRSVENVFAANWTPDEARGLLTALSEPGAATHHDCLQRLIPVLDQQADDFVAAFKSHFDEHYASFQFQQKYARGP